MTRYSQFTINIKTQTIKTGIILGLGLVENLSNLKELKRKKFSSFLLLTDKTIFSLVGKKVVDSLKATGKPVISSIIDPGENMKSIDKIPAVVKPFFNHGFDRNSCLIALGGGVITDLGGFIASLLLRGITHVNIPTTLLGMVDAAIGGKTGVNFHLNNKQILKNMLGTIKQPDLVINDISLLRSLPPREYKSGLGEIIKYWIGWGKPTLLDIKKLQSNPVDQILLEKVISTCQKIKSDLIQKDPFDVMGIREKLNLGHTIGHALEGSKRTKLTHGEAVALGLIASLKISVLSKLLTKNKHDEIIQNIKDLDFTISIKGVNKNMILKSVKSDKKNGMFVLVKDIGDIVTKQKVNEKNIKIALNEIIL